MNELDIFSAALDLPDPPARARYLDGACAGHPDLRSRIDALLRNAGDASRYLESSPQALLATIDAPSERVGKLIGPYKLRELLGEGGMGVVYVAEQEQPVRRKVALKIIKPGMDSKQVIARFEAERQALAMMDHPNIAKILDAGTTGEGRAQIPLPMGEAGTDAERWSRRPGEGLSSSLAPGPCPLTPGSGRPYFVMELVRGIPITDFCDQHALDTRQRLEIFIQVCRAIQHAHQKGIIHRDIKPSNVLVTLHDDQPIPKVIDFGIAKATQARSVSEASGDGHSIYTGFAQMLGTPLYMSPEQAELNALDIDTRSDVYSLGVLLYELLTGTTPFDKDRLKSVTFDEMRRIIREEEPETVSVRLAKTRRGVGVSPAQSSRQTPSAVASSDGVAMGRAANHGSASALNPKSKIGAPALAGHLKSFAELDWIVARSLEKDRSRRYESASSLAKDIERYLSGDLVHACPPSPAYRFRKFAKKNKTALTTAALLLVSLLLGATVSTWQAIRAIAAEAQAITNEEKAKAEEQKAVIAAQAEKEQRQRAEASEQEAKQRLAEAELRRQQAQKNLIAALDAVDRLLANVNDPELSAVPKVGALQKKMLHDTVAFYDRLSAQSEHSVVHPFHWVKTWQAIAWAARDLGEHAVARRAFDNTIAMQTNIVLGEPSYPGHKNELGKFHSSAGTYYANQGANRELAEKHFRKSSELFAELVSEYPNATPVEMGKHPNTDAYVIRQAAALGLLAGTLRHLGKTEEAIGCYKRKLDLIPRSRFATANSRAGALYGLAWCHKNGSAAQDDLFRQALAEYRAYVATGNATGHDRGQIAGKLRVIAEMFSKTFPHEAEKIFDECVSLTRSATSPFTRHRDHLFFSSSNQLSYARHLRQLASRSDITDGAEKAAERRALAATLFEEVISTRRKMVAQYSFAQDKFDLVQILQEEGEYLLGPHSKSNAAAVPPAADSPPLNPEPRTLNPSDSKLRADALLTEAIQLCRALAAEFPDNQGYQSRLAALLKLQAQHFGQTDDAKQGNPQPSAAEQPK